MSDVVAVLLAAGRSAIDVALYTLLPIMVTMMVAMRLLEASGGLDRLMRLATPVLRPFGLDGMGLVAMLQMGLVSFVAPISTLRLMEDRGVPDRRIAAAFAAILGMAPANAVFPLAAMGLDAGRVMPLSLAGGLIAAAATYWVLGRHLSNDARPAAAEEQAEPRMGLLQIIGNSGREAMELVVNIVPMLLLSLAVVTALQRAGAIDALAAALAPSLARAQIPGALLLPAITKLLAGSTAFVGVVHQMYADHRIDAAAINAGGSVLLNPIDLPGVAIFAAASRALGRCAVPAVLGGCVGVLARCVVESLASWS